MITLREAIKLTDKFHKENRPEYEISGYQEHGIMVGACASIIAAACGLDVLKVGVMGYCHDIGKLISNEAKNKTFHGLTGYEYFKSVGEDELAQICLTHSFPCPNFMIEEYFNYGINNIKKTKSILESMKLTDYDKIIQLSDLLAHFDGQRILYENIKSRMNYIEEEYHIEHQHIRKKYKNAIVLKRYIEKKYNCNIYKLLGIK